MQLVIQKSGGRQYVSIRESFWDKERKKYSSRTIKNFGRLDLLEKDDPNALDKLRQQLEELRAERDARKEEVVKMRFADGQRVLDELSKANLDTSSCKTLMLGPTVYRQIWNKLSLTRKLREFQKKGKTQYDLAESIFYMVMARSLMPDSKIKQWEQRNKVGPASAKLKLCHLYRSLEQLEANRDKLITYLNKQIAKSYQREISVALYDVTTYWFESQNADSLRNFGFSKDNKVNQVQVVMGLLIDQNGIPIDYQLFPGNTNEFGTMIPLLKRLKEQYNLKRVIVTADRGLNSGKNLQQLLDLGMDYVIAYRLRNSGEKVRELIADKSGWTYRKGSSLCDVSKYRISTETRDVRWVDEETGEIVRKKLTSQLLINYSAKRACKDARDRERLIDKAKRFEENPALLKSELRRGGKGYLKVDAEKLTAEVDEERIAANAFFDGYYGLSYSNPDMSPEEVLSVHHSLWKIEESFRISKSLLDARPCFHWKEARIRGHFLICYLALVMHRLLEKELADAGVSMSAQRIVDALSRAHLIESDIPNIPNYFLKGDTDEDFETIWKAMGFEPLLRASTPAVVRRVLKVKEL